MQGFDFSNVWSGEVDRYSCSESARKIQKFINRFFFGPFNGSSLQVFDFFLRWGRIRNEEISSLNSCPARLRYWRTGTTQESMNAPFFLFLSLASVPFLPLPLMNAKMERKQGIWSFVKSEVHTGYGTRYQVHGTVPYLHGWLSQSTHASSSINTEGTNRRLDWRDWEAHDCTVATTIDFFWHVTMTAHTSYRAESAWHRRWQ